MKYDQTPATIAFVIDGQVVQIMGTDERLAAILLSEPIIVDVSGLDLELVTPENFDVTTNTFKNPSA